MKAPLILKLTFLFFGISIAATAQTEALVLTSTTLDSKARPSTSKIYLKDGLMVSQPSDERDEMVMFDAEKEILYIINHKKKEYTALTREELEALNTMLQKQMSAMEQQLAMLPAEQREMIREKMGAAFGNTKAPEYSLEASEVMVKNWEADKYVGLSDGKKQSEIYIATYDDLGQDAADFAAMNKFFEYIKNYMKGISKNLSAVGFGFFSKNMPGFKEGIPVKTVLYNSAGQALSTSTLETISEEEVEEAIFILPETYKKKELSNFAEN